jgi:hypothetical protein
MNIVSIDPAPSKPAIAFDGSFHTVDTSELVAYCDSLASPETLLCWDAPLTGPSSPRGSFSQRIIEQFFSRGKTGFKTPKGISVLPYSGCPHWAITRACLGLPICGEHDLPSERLPFMLTTDVAELIPDHPRVIETHPAVAIWLWCRELDDEEQTRSWVYKGSNRSRRIEEMWTLLTGVWMATEHPAIIEAMSRPANVPNDDDKLDAFVGWVLGTLLLSNHPSVGILGDAASGAIALPMSTGLQTAFDTFREQNLT